mgnify:CR=1 FL=1
MPSGADEKRQMTSSRGQGPDRHGHTGRAAPPDTAQPPSDGGQDAAASHAELVRAVRETAERIERQRLAEGAAQRSNGVADEAPAPPSQPQRPSRPRATTAERSRHGAKPARRTGRRMLLLAALFVALLSAAGVTAFVIGAGSNNQAVVGDV